MCRTRLYICSAIGIDGNHKTNNMSNTNQIIGWSVSYVPTKEGRLFAGIKSEKIATFKCQFEAIAFCENENMCGYIDEMHIGYRVYPIYQN